VQVALLASDEVDDSLADFVELLADSVAEGNSVGFTDPLDHDDLARFWRASLTSSGTLTWVAREPDGRIVGCVQLKCVPYSNGTHRADVAKLLVHTSARGRGLSSQLMTALEIKARELGRTLLMLDTQTTSAAESLYERWGWHRYGVVPGYAAWPDGSLGATTFFYKQL